MIKYFSPHQRSKTILFTGKDLVNKVVFSTIFTKLIVTHSDFGNEIIVSSSYFQNGMEITKEKWAVNIMSMAVSNFSIFEELLVKRMRIRTENDFWTLHLPSMSDESFTKFTNELEKIFVFEVLKSNPSVEHENH